MLLSGTIPYTLISYPRSGGNYARDLLDSRLSLRSTLHHKLSEVKAPSFTIAVVRNPLDCFASIIVQDPKVDLLNGSSISDISNSFISSMNEIEKNAKIIIDFNELESDPESVIQKISSRLFIPIIDSNKDIKIMDDPALKYLASSKSLKNYNDAVNTLKQMDLSSVMEAYNRVIAKAI